MDEVRETTRAKVGERIKDEVNNENECKVQRNKKRRTNEKGE